MEDKELVDLVRAFPNKRILIVGDVILDEYISGEVQRISPEAPVPIFEIQDRSYAPGGAANVAANITSLGGQAILGGIVGEDHMARELCESLLRCGVDNSGLVPASERPTTVKTRIVAQSQQIVRIDQEKRTALLADGETSLLRWIEGQMPTADACVISDYGKGVVSNRLAQDLIRLARRANKPVVVDPKGSDYRKYGGATVLAPNFKEAVQASSHKTNHESDLGEIGECLLDILPGSAVLITRGEQGMTLFRKGAAAMHIPAEAHSVFDVTGAGDTCISVLALTMGAGATLEHAACLANKAAGIVVGKRGTATVTVSELQQPGSDSI